LAEEKIVYRLAREEIKDTDLMDEADVEHAGAKNLIKELSKMNPEDSHYGVVPFERTHYVLFKGEEI
jgi:hypothetical protein